MPGSLERGSTTKETPVNDVRCSFCGTAMPKDKAKGQFVAGAEVFICRGCVEMCIDIFSASDPEWRDRQVAKLTDLREKLQNST
jgi:ATP-dependent protease Clp ATPase subunit